MDDAARLAGFVNDLEMMQSASGLSDHDQERLQRLHIEHPLAVISEERSEVPIPPKSRYPLTLGDLLERGYHDEQGVMSPIPHYRSLKEGLRRSAWSQDPLKIHFLGKGL